MKKILKKLAAFAAPALFLFGARNSAAQGSPVVICGTNNTPGTSTYNVPAPLSLTNQPNSITYGSNGLIFTQTGNNQISLINNNNVLELVPNSSGMGAYAVGIEGSGPLYFATFTSPKLYSNGTHVAGNGSFLPTATDGPALSRGIGIVSSIAPDPTNDQMYLGTTGGRVLAFDPSTTPDSVYVKMDVPGFSQAVAFANGYIWAGGSSGLAKVDPVTEVYTVISTTITPNALSCMGSTLYAVDGDAVYEINTLTGDATYLFTEDASIFGLTAKPPNSLIYTKGSSQTVVERSLTALPVELVAYDARETPPGNLITWKTTSESNSADFTVRHSTDFDRNWTTIATVPAAGNSTEPLSYSVTHTDFAAGNNYYELREKDLDGTEESLGVRTVFNAAGRTGIEIYPNPAQDRLNIKGLDPDLENAPYEIHDALGRTKRSGVVDLFNGAGGIDLGVLVPGLHTIQFGNPANGNTPVGAVQRFMVR